MGYPEGTRPDRTAQGIVIILASVLVMAFADAVVKLGSADLTLWQVLIARSLVAIPIAVVIARATGTGLKSRVPAWVLLRSGLLVLTWLAFYASLPVLSLSVAAVAVYTNPIMTALLAAALIGEPVSRRQWGGVLLGFAGVFAILKPGGDAFPGSPCCRFWAPPSMPWPWFSRGANAGTRRRWSWSSTFTPRFS
ncbi:MAG: DMT family transporter [Proteobacteria bacterium]|nr:DMT family transporter [Pseudomonadota bacterium]